MTLTRAEADQIAKEAIEQGWAEEVNSEKVTETGEGQVEVYENYGGDLKDFACDRPIRDPAQDMRQDVVAFYGLCRDLVAVGEPNDFVTTDHVSVMATTSPGGRFHLIPHL